MTEEPTDEELSDDPPRWLQEAHDRMQYGMLDDPKAQWHERYWMTVNEARARAGLAEHEHDWCGIATSEGHVIQEFCTCGATRPPWNGLDNVGRIVDRMAYLEAQNAELRRKFAEAVALAKEQREMCVTPDRSWVTTYDLAARDHDFFVELWNGLVRGLGWVWDNKGPIMWATFCVVYLVLVMILSR